MGLRDELIRDYGPGIVAEEIDGRTIYFRRLMGDEGAQLLRGELKPDEMAAGVLYLSLCEEDGTLCFESLDDVRTHLHVGFIAKASERAMRVNGLLGDDAAGKSEETPGGGSPSG